MTIAHNQHPRMPLVPAMRRAVALGTLLVLVLTYPAAAVSVTQTIPVGPQPYGVVLTPDGHLYVSNYGTNTISVVDPSTANSSTVSPTITVGHAPGRIAIDPGANRAYVSNFNDVTVSVIDIAAGSVIATIAPGGSGVAVDPALSRLYVANSSRVVVFDTVTLQQVGMILAPSGTSGWWAVAVDSVRHLGYVGDLSSHLLTVLDLQTSSIVTTIDVGGPVRLALATDPSRGRVFVATDTTSGRLSVIDSTSDLVVGSVTVGDFPTDIAIAAADRVYVSDAGSNDLAVVDPTTLSVSLHPINATGSRTSCPSNGGPCPSGIALVGNVPYVALSGSNVLAVIGESAPVIDGITLAPSPPKTNDTVTATVAVHDADGDQLTYAYQWTKNGVEIAGATTLRLDLSASGNGDRGDRIAFRLTVSDATHTTTSTSQPVVVADSEPVVDSVTLSPSTPRTNDTLTASVSAHDADGDALTYSYQWTRNGSDISGAAASTLDLSTPGNGDRGDSIAVRVTASDGSLTSARVTSAPIVIADTAPVVSVSLNTGAPTTRTVLTATVAATDADGDALTFTYVWKVNGEIRSRTVTAATTDTFDLGRPGNGNKDDVITVEVTASDGSLTGTASASGIVTPGHP